jgi:hypothetical protein
MRVRDLPPVPSLADAPDDHLQGHVWAQELLDGGPVRFAVADAGYLRFGDAGRVFDDGEVPPALRYAGRALDRRFDIGAYLETVDEPARYTFVGVATHRRHVDYDWDRLPAVLGTAIWDGQEDRWLPPDRVDGVFDRLGPPPVTVVEKERSIDQQPLAGYELLASAWYDGPAAGVTFVDKMGNRAKLVRDDVPSAVPSVQVDAADPRALTERLVTDELVADRAATLRAGDEPVAFDPLFEAVVDRVARAHHDTLFHSVTDTGAVDLDWSRFRGAVAERVRRWLDGG